MTLSTSQPTDQALNAEWPSWIRTLAAAVNGVISSDSEITITDLVIAAGSILLDVGVELTAIKHETLLTVGGGAANIQQIRSGTEGQIKVFIFTDNNITFTAGAKTLGGIFLNQPLASTINFNASDILVLQNIDGDGDTVDGYWQELYRKLSIR
jgi:hypothetical protein